jgi:hypothetical protein
VQTFSSSSLVEGFYYIILILLRPLKSANVQNDTDRIDYVVGGLLMSGAG